MAWILPDLHDYLECLLMLPFESSDYSSQPVGLTETIKLAQTYRLTIYDAGYLALALNQKTSLATIDSALARAAENINCLFSMH